eukprot:3693759-Pleurochrysis_carterae.AAC.2
MCARVCRGHKLAPSRARLALLQAAGVCEAYEAMRVSALQRCVRPRYDEAQVCRAAERVRRERGPAHAVEVLSARASVLRASAS